MRFQATDDTDHVEISGVNYVVDENGGFNCDNTDHQPLIRQLGFRGEADPAPIVAPVKADTPPEVPEGYLNPEAVTALVEENEDMRQGLLRLQGQLEQSQSDLQAAVTRANNAEGELSSAKLVEDGLRDRIQELEGQLNATTEGRDAALQELADERARTTERVAEDTSGDTGGADATATDTTAEEAPPAVTGKKGK
jgi:hypothetical protein